MFLTFFVLLAGFLIILTYYLRRQYTYWERKGVPHEQPTIPFGNLKGIGRKLHFRDINERIYKRFKGSAPFAGMYLMFKPNAIVLDLELARHVLIKDFGNFSDRGMYHNVRDDPLSGHLFSLEGEQWRILRHKITPSFTSGKMKLMFPAIEAVAKNLIETCATLTAANEDGVLDLKELCARYTTDVIGTCAFGIECNSLKDPNAEFRLKGRAIFEKPRHLPIIQSLMITSPAFARFFHMKLFPDDVTEFFLNVVRSTVEYRLKNNVKRNDFMDLLIELKANDADFNQNSEGGIDFTHGLTLEQMTAQAFGFFVAGFHTSSLMMANCIYELALNQDIQAKLREEIHQVLVKHDQQLSYENMNEMPYLDQVIAETLRKHTSLPHLLRKAEADYKVPNSNYVIEAGTGVIIPVAAFHNDPEYFPEPDKFDPARFDLKTVKNFPDFSYLPFGEGPRNCIGVRFARMQSKIGLINLVKHYKFTKCAQTEVPMEISKRNFFIGPKNGVYLHAERL